MKKYRKKPVIVEAIQWDGKNVKEIFLFCDAYMIGDNMYMKDVQNNDQDFRLDLNDYIICGVNGEYYPCKPDIFKNTYEEVKNEQ